MRHASCEQVDESTMNDDSSVRVTRKAPAFETTRTMAPGVARGVDATVTRTVEPIASPLTMGSRVGSPRARMAACAGHAFANTAQATAPRHASAQNRRREVPAITLVAAAPQARRRGHDLGGRLGCHPAWKWPHSTARGFLQLGRIGLRP